MERELGWASVNAYGEWVSGASSFGREAKREVVLTVRLKLPAGDGFLLGWPPRFAVLALQSLDAGLPAEALDAAVEDRARSETLWQRPAARCHSHFLLDDRFNLRLVGFHFPVYLDSMKTTIDIPDSVLADAMRFTGAKTKREAVVKALEAYNRQQRVNDLVASFGTWNIATNDEIEAGDLAEIAARQDESKTRATAKR